MRIGQFFPLQTRKFFRSCLPLGIRYRSRISTWFSPCTVFLEHCAGARWRGGGRANKTERGRVLFGQCLCCARPLLGSLRTRSHLILMIILWAGIIIFFLQMRKHSQSGSTCTSSHSQSVIDPWLKSNPAWFRSPWSFHYNLGLVKYGIPGNYISILQDVIIIIWDLCLTNTHRHFSTCISYE